MLGIFFILLFGLSLGASLFLVALASLMLESCESPRGSTHRELPTPPLGLPRLLG